MPMYILHRTHTHRSTSGVISFVAGEPTGVPHYMENEVVAIGAVRADNQAVDLIPADNVPVLPPDGEDRDKVIFAAFETLIASNVTTDFTGQGVPTVKAMEKVLGFDVDKVEVTTKWAEYKVIKAES